MRVGVTGGAGFIGQRVVHVLQQRGHEALVFDRHYNMDVRDRDVVDRELAGCDAVIHLAGVLGTGELFDKPQLAVNVNVTGALNVLEACRKHEMGYVGITMPNVWENVYQATKRCARDLASAWCRHYGLPVSHVRAFNAYGPGQKVTGVQKIVPTFAVHAWKGEPIPIWGDGTQMVDLVYVDDVAIMLCDALAFGDDEVFDAGTGTALSVNEVADTILEMTGSDAGVQHLPMRRGEHPVTKLCAEGEGWELLDWSPVFQESKLEATVRWYEVYAS